MLPIDIQFGVQTPDINASTLHSYIQKLQRRLEWAYKTSDEVSKRSQNIPKSNMIETLDAPVWSQDILSLSDKGIQRKTLNQ